MLLLIAVVVQLQFLIQFVAMRGKRNYYLLLVFVFFKFGLFGLFIGHLLVGQKFYNVILPGFLLLIICFFGHCIVFFFSKNNGQRKNVRDMEGVLSNLEFFSLRLLVFIIISTKLLKTRVFCTFNLENVLRGFSWSYVYSSHQNT